MFKYLAKSLFPNIDAGNIASFGMTDLVNLPALITQWIAESAIKINGFWKLGGNELGSSDVTIGSIDDQPVNILVNNQLAWRFISNKLTNLVPGNTPHSILNIGMDALNRHDKGLAFQFEGSNMSITLMDDGDGGVGGIAFYNEGDLIASIGIDGTYSQISDKSRKTDVITMTKSTKFGKLNPVKFKFEGNDSQKRGFIAQEVQEIYPELVSKSGEILTVNYTGLIPVLVAELQHTNSELASLKAEVKKLKGKDGGSIKPVLK